jgi:hydrophobe/amphiphile efflux-3 (HAE3) family protein
VADGAFPNADVTITGAPYFLKDINDYLKGGMLQLGAIAVVVMTIILLLLFHVRWRLLPLLVVLVGVIWAFGLAGYLGIPLTLVTIAGLPVMLGIGIDYAIQMHARVEEEVIIDRDPHPIQETARGLGPALLVVTFDAVFAFAALRFALVPMIREFGLLLAVGIIVICVTSIVLPLSILGIREYKSPTKGRDFREGLLGRLTKRLGSLPLRIAPVLVILSIAIFIGGLVVEGQLELQTDPIQWVDQSSRSIKDFRFVEEQTGSSSELSFFIETAPDAVFAQPTVDFVAEFARGLLDRYGSEIPEGKISPELLTATSVVTTVDAAITVPGGATVNPRGSDVEAAYRLAPRDIQISTVNPEAGAQNLIFRYGDRTLDERKTTVDDIRESAAPPEGVYATPSGLAIVGVALLKNLEANRILLTYVAIAFVGIFLAIRLKSVVRSLLSLVPVGIAVGASSIIAWALNLKLSPMTAVGGPLIVAVCTEFTSLILLRYLEERRRGLWPRQAIDVAASRTGRAFIVSALTAISGVLVISLSSLPLLRGFGLIVGMNVAVALLSALVILPPMLVWADNRGWVSKGEVPDDILQTTTPRFAGRAEPAPETPVESMR